MDNIQKMIAGCLGLAGLIVMVVPNSDPLASTKDEAVDAPAIANGAPGGPGAMPPPPPPQAAAPEQLDANSEFVVNDYDVNNFGQPMVDPTPPGQREFNAQQQQQAANQGNNNGPPVLGGNPQGPAGPPPPPPVAGY